MRSAIFLSAYMLSTNPFSDRGVGVVLFFLCIFFVMDAIELGKKK